MSHSKMTKRGRSHFVESWNPKAKNFINTCALCGARGYSPTIDEDGFVYEGEARFPNFEHRAIRDELTRILSPLPLDSLGRCQTCSAVMDREK